MSDATLREARLAEATRKQRSAADPAVSAWVRANAGTGKTHVLVQRILRLCLAGAAPRSILCLTFTKNAAAEMEARVLKTMGEWATIDAPTLDASLAALLNRPAEAAELSTARTLFATVTDAPGGLPIMTIHSFCERLLRRFSFEANVPPGFTVLTEEEARDALAAAKAEAFSSAKTGAMRDALATTVAYAGEDEFGRVLRDMIGHRRDILYLLRVGPEDDRVAGIEARLRRFFGLAAGETADGLIARAAAVLPDGVLREIVAAFSEGQKTDTDIAAALLAALRAPDVHQRCACLKDAFATKKGEPKKKLGTAAMQNRVPALCERLYRAQEAFFDLDRRIRGAKVVAATAALFRLTEAIFEAYEAEKRVRGAVDFDDLIEKALGLLHRDDAAEWVLYQLDGRINHLLVDEAQDTSPEQWAIIAALAEDFFSGDGARDTLPTLFAVGDEKQSIYGFQGAQPELLAGFGAAYEAKAQTARLPFRAVDLDLSFRTLTPVLSAVDLVAARLDGLLSGAPMPHIANRDDVGGLVELWQPETAARQDRGDVWAPQDDAAAAIKPAEALAARIADTIRDWLDGGAELGREGRPVLPGDIMILLKKREPMASLLQAALKRKRVPVAGADRMSLVDDLAVMDLLALGDAVLQPEDDLALAAALKSPLFGLCDDDLFALCHGRETSLWAALAERAETDRSGRLAEAAGRLAAWRDLAHRLTPFDFYATVLDHPAPVASQPQLETRGAAFEASAVSPRTDGRAAFGARMGAKCFDALDELSNLAETFSAAGRGGLADFLTFVRQGAAEVKRETDQAAREVRIMTVHGAKGLEAPIVILADACAVKAGRQPPIFLLADTQDGVNVPVWAIKGAATLPPIADKKERLTSEARRESGRLLYVAMTRARDRLYIAGCHAGETLPAGCWFETVKNALETQAEEGRDASGRPFWRLDQSALNRARLDAGELADNGSLRRAASDLRRDAVGSGGALAAPASIEPQWLTLPRWAATRAPAGNALVLLSPSGFDVGEAVEDAPSVSHDPVARETAQKRGIFIHRLLEVLPALPEDRRHHAARLIASAYRDALPGEIIEAAIESVTGLLAIPDLERKGKDLLVEAGLAVAFMAGARRAAILGQCDRISLGADDIALLDYKSGGTADDAQLHPAHVAQLAAYRLALLQIYPQANIRASVLNTRSATVSDAENEALDAFIGSLGRELGELSA